MAEKNEERRGQATQERPKWKPIREGVSAVGAKFIAWQVLDDQQGGTWLSMENRKGRITAPMDVLVKTLTEATKDG